MSFEKKCGTAVQWVQGLTEDTKVNTGEIWPDWGKYGRASAAVTCFFVILAWLIGAEAVAKPIGHGEVSRAVAGWLGKGRQHLGRWPGREIESIETYRDEQARPVYYIVNLKSGGFLIVSGDDLVEPIIGIVSGGSYDASDENPLGALVNRDVRNRVEAARQADRGADMRGLGRAAEKARSKWAQLIAYDGDTVGTEGYSFISEVWVEPLVQSEWGQRTECSKACYNYYTPPYEPGDVDNYRSGCVATAMAQLMRRHQFPTAGIGVNSFTIVVDGSSETAYTRGGNGSGGSYNWGQMVPVPGCGADDAQRAAIGSLCYDAGISVGTNYSSGGSGAYVYLAKNALLNTFTYSNAIDGWNNNNNIGPGLTGMLNPDLDAGLPVLLGITASGLGHSVVADGYGYDGSTLYHHLNMGWQGSDDAWYNLPNINSIPAFSSVNEVIYNICVSETGEIISGRVTDVGTDLPVEGATVTAVRTGGGTYVATTNSNGIYALVGVPSNSDYTVSAVKPGYSFTDKAASTDSSQDDQAVSGNCWGVDFAGLVTSASPPIAFDDNVVTEPATSVEIALEAMDEHLPNPPGMLSYVITSLPSYGVLSDPYAGDIDSTPYVLADDGNRVIYTPGGCQMGLDSFQFKANDGGTPPDGGDSNIATVTVEVVSQAQATVIYETGFDGGLDANFSVVNGGSSSDTWTSSNPGGRSSPYWTGTFMIVDSDWAGHEDMDEQLITPSIDCSGFTGVTLKFNHEFVYYTGVEWGDVDVRIGGGSWQNVESYHGIDYAGEVELPLSGFGADEASDVQVRWHYYDANYDYYWGIDDVQISGLPESQPGVGDFNRDCVVDYYDLCLFASTWLKGLGEPGYNADCNLSGDDFIDGADFAGFALNWLVNTQ